jgi:hypothetical protein
MFFSFLPPFFVTKTQRDHGTQKFLQKTFPGDSLYPGGKFFLKKLTLKVNPKEERGGYIDTHPG